MPKTTTELLKDADAELIPLENKIAAFSGSFTATSFFRAKALISELSAKLRESEEKEKILRACLFDVLWAKPSASSLLESCENLDEVIEKWKFVCSKRRPKPTPPHKEQDNVD